MMSSRSVMTRVEPLDQFGLLFLGAQVDGAETFTLDLQAFEIALDLASTSGIAASASSPECFIASCGSQFSASRMRASTSLRRSRAAVRRSSARARLLAGAGGELVGA
jgi:hypothetical protein